MQKQNFHFFYSILGTDGDCDCVSVAQAINRAKVRYLYKRHGVKTTSPDFARYMAGLRDTPVRVELDSAHVRRMVELYRSKKDGDISKAEDQELKTLSTILRDPRYK